MRALQMPKRTGEQPHQFADVYRTTKEVKIRSRAQMVFLACEQHLSTPHIAAIVREDDETVRRWLTRSLAEGINGLFDRPRAGGPSKTTKAYEEQVLATVRRRPRSLRQPYSMWTQQRLAEYLAEQTAITVSVETVRRLFARQEMVFRQPQHPMSSPDPDYASTKQMVEEARDRLKEGEIFSYADEFNVSLLLTLRALWSRKEQQVMVRTLGQQTTHDGIGAVNYIIRVKRWSNSSVGNGGKRSRSCWKLLSKSTQMEPFLWPGTTPIPMRMRTSMRSFRLLKGD